MAVEKIMMSVPDKFELKILAIKKSHGLTTTHFIAKLICKLQALKERDTILNFAHVERCFSSQVQRKETWYKS